MCLGTSTEGSGSPQGKRRTTDLEQSIEANEQISGWSAAELPSQTQVLHSQDQTTCKLRENQRAFSFIHSQSIRFCSSGNRAMSSTVLQQPAWHPETAALRVEGSGEREKSSSHSSWLPSYGPFLIRSIHFYQFQAVTELTANGTSQHHRRVWREQAARTLHPYGTQQSTHLPTSPLPLATSFCESNNSKEIEK